MNRERFREGFLHLFKAAGYSLAGLRTGVRLSLAFRQECGVLLALIVLLAVCGKPLVTWLVALGAWLLVMMAELINTAIEEALMLALNAALWFCIFILGLF